MGFIWDMIQQSQISDSTARTSNLEDRVAHLEDELYRMHRTLTELVRLLEKRFGEDLDGDGSVG